MSPLRCVHNIISLCAQALTRRVRNKRCRKIINLIGQKREGLVNQPAAVFLGIGDANLRYYSFEIKLGIIVKRHLLTHTKGLWREIKLTFTIQRPSQQSRSIPASAIVNLRRVTE